MAYQKTTTANATTGTAGTSSSIPASGRKNFTLVATVGSEYIDVDLEGSADGTNFYTIATMGSAGPTETVGTMVSNQAHNLVRANVKHYSAGTYTVSISMNGGN